MLLIESLLLLEEWPLPLWFFPSYTAHDILSFMHKLFPAFINCARVVTGAFHVDKKDFVIKELKDIVEIAEKSKEKIEGSVKRLLSVRAHEILSIRSTAHEAGHSSDEGIGIMELAVRDSRRLSNSTLSSKSLSSTSGTVKSKWIFWRNVLAYVVVTYLHTLYKSRKNHKSAS